jgi:putative acetyltransferase
MIIRSEEESDYPIIRALLEEAFGRRAEADLLEALRKDGDLAFAGVAVRDGEIIGHVAFSKLAAPFPALGLGPIAASHEHRRIGAASALVRWGLEFAAQDGWRAVFVLGDPAFYRRFRFETALADCFSSSYAGPHFMALALGGPLPTLKGRVDYPPAFERLAPR